MFSKRGKAAGHVVAEGKIPGAGGEEWVSLPLETWLTFKLASTPRGIAEEVAALRNPKPSAKKRDFAMWLAERSAAEGLVVEEVRLRRQMVGLRTGQVTWIELGTYPVLP